MNMSQLRKTKEYLDSNKELMKDFSTKVHAISSKFKGDGCGLSSGTLVDMFVNEFFEKNLKENYEELHEGECDLKLFGMKLSLKKISGPADIALNWSKNKVPENDKKDYFKCNFMIIVLESKQWWKDGPKKERVDNVVYSNEIPAGIYFVDKKFCKQNVTLTSNNKSNSIISKKDLYLMLDWSIKKKLNVKLPKPNKKIKFNILEAKVEEEEPVKEVKTKKKREKKDKDAPKGARSAWIYFCEVERKKMVKEKSKLNAKEKMAELSERWAKVKGTKKAKKFEDMAVEDKKRFAKEMEEYEG